MNVDAGRKNITDDLGNDVEFPIQAGMEYQALCAVADAADQEHRSHCLLLTVNCPICRTLAELDVIRRKKAESSRN